jgi:hypothetical protein
MIEENNGNTVSGGRDNQRADWNDSIQSAQRPRRQWISASFQLRRGRKSRGRACDWICQRIHRHETREQKQLEYHLKGGNGKEDNEKKIEVRIKLKSDEYGDDAHRKGEMVFGSRIVESSTAH